MQSSLRVIVTGLIAQHPLVPGMTWHYLQYVIGLTRLGHDVPQIRCDVRKIVTKTSTRISEPMAAKAMNKNLNLLLFQMNFFVILRPAS